MFFILLLGVFLRLTFINKAEGLWNDEYVSWMISATPFNQGFWNEVFKQCHMPLYYLYLKPFSGCSDLILRLTSLVPSVIAIWIMYLIGKEYSKKTGIFAASITSVLSFLVYYAQEVRFYSILFLFSAFTLFYTIRLLKENNIKNLSGYIISSLLIIFTHILGIIFVFLNTLYILYKYKKLTKVFIIWFSIISLALLPLFINIMAQLPSSQWWGKFSYTNILFLFSDYLSPILTNNVNAPPIFFYNIKYALWITIPTVIGILGVVFAIKNNKGVTVAAFLYIVALSILAASGKIVFITKYSIETLPIIILLLSVGFTRTNKFGLILFALFISFHLASFFTPYYVTKIYRSEGHRIVGEILNHRNPEKIIYTYYAPDRFKRYYKDNVKEFYVSKVNRFEYKNSPVKILDNINNGEIFSIVFLDSVSFLDEDYLKKYKNNIPEMFATFSHIRNALVDELENNYKIISVDVSGSWTVITAKK